MKKYLSVPLPLAACSLLAYLYGSQSPADYPAPSYPYRTREVLDYLSGSWFIIGAVLSALLFILLIVDDIASFINRKLRERRVKNQERREIDSG